MDKDEQTDEERYLRWERIQDRQDKIIQAYIKGLEENYVDFDLDSSRFGSAPVRTSYWDLNTDG